MRLFVLLIVATLCTGCWQRCSATVDISPVESALAAGPRVDSILFGEGCTGYTCYFTEGALNKKALEHIAAVLYGSFAICEDFDDYPDPESVNRYRTHFLDSLSSIEWLETEPWPTMRRQYLEWSRQQLERYYIVYMAQRDPSFLYHCSEADSVLTRGADILLKGGEGYVDAVRRFLKENASAEAMRYGICFDSPDYKYTLSLIDKGLSLPDSVDNADSRMFQLLGNHINHKIHNRLGEKGTVDFFSYNDDFIRIFDSVRIEEYEP